LSVSLVENDTVQLLRRLQQRLTEEGHRVQGEMMGKVADRISSADDVEKALEQLYSVQGWDAIALRLMWYASQSSGKNADIPRDSLIEYQMEELHALLMAASSGEGEDSRPSSPEGTPQLTGAVFEGVFQFTAALDNLKQSAFEGERFQGMRQGLVDAALLQAGRMHQASSAAGNEILAQFAAAFSLFLRYVIERDLFDDVRVAHLIDNASQSVQGLLESTGREQYDSLQQTVGMLQNPETLLE
jgi:hypothetical protein